MRRAARFLLALLAGLALLAVVGDQVLTRTARAWFDRDLEIRTLLAANAASRSLADHWDDPAGLTEVLTDLTRDERIMASAACSPNQHLLARTSAFPNQFTCDTPQGEIELPSGPVHLSATTPEGVNGTVMLVHDIAFLQRRENTTRKILLVGFFVLSLIASNGVSR